MLNAPASKQLSTETKNTQLTQKMYNQWCTTENAFARLTGVDGTHHRLENTEADIWDWDDAGLLLLVVAIKHCPAKPVLLCQQKSRTDADCYVA